MCVHGHTSLIHSRYTNTNPKNKTKHNTKKQVEGTVPPALATAALSQWEQHFKGRNPQQQPHPSHPWAATPNNATKEIPFADTARVRRLVEGSGALLVVRVVLSSGATVRDGVEIDVAEQVRNLPQVRAGGEWDGMCTYVLM